MAQDPRLLRITHRTVVRWRDTFILMDHFTTFASLELVANTYSLDRAEALQVPVDSEHCTPIQDQTERAVCVIA